MLAHLVKKEILDSLLNQRFIALAVFSIVLMPLSALINYQYFEARKTAFDSQFAEYNQQEDHRYDNRAYRPPELLSVLARGTEPYMPLYFRFEDVSSGRSTSAITPGNVEALEFSMLSTFGSFDFLFLVQIVFSLLAVLLAFDMIAGEKERGTLKAVLANRVPRDSVILGKFLGGFSVLAMAYLIGFLLLYLVLAVSDSRFLYPEIVVRMLFLVGLSTVFLAGFFSIGLMVSTFCHSTRTAIVALLVVWVLLQLVIPKAGELIAVVIHPVRSEHEIRTEIATIIDEEREQSENKAGQLYERFSGRNDLEGAFQLLSSDASWVPAFREQYQEEYLGMRQRMQDRVREVQLTWEREKTRQKQLGRRIALISPASALAFMLSDAAGTGDLAYSEYRTAIADYYQVVDREVFARQQSQSFRIRLGQSMIAGGFGGSEEEAPTDLPPFTVTPPRLDRVLIENALGLGLLAFYLIVPFLIGYFRFLRYDVR
ncbi:MAG: ABC transporter permease subunit [Rhodothermales bacterium]